MVENVAWQTEMKKSYKSNYIKKGININQPKNLLYLTNLGVYTAIEKFGEREMDILFAGL